MANNNEITITNVLKTLTVQAAQDLARSAKAVATVGTVASATGAIVTVDKTGEAAQYVADKCNSASLSMASWISNKYAARIQAGAVVR